MIEALRIAHLIGLMLGFAGVFGGVLTLGHARPAQKQKGGSLRGINRVFANLATFGDTPVDAADADLAWRHYAAVDAVVKGNVGVLRRAAGRLSPVSLFG